MIITKHRHQFVAGFGVLFQPEASFLGGFGEGEARKGDGHDVEGGIGVSAFYELGEDLGDFDETSWPLMYISQCLSNNIFVSIPTIFLQSNPVQSDSSQTARDRTYTHAQTTMAPPSHTHSSYAQNAP
jgi:hypothetical protein